MISDPTYPRTYPNPLEDLHASLPYLYVVLPNNCDVLRQDSNLRPAA